MSDDAEFLLFVCSVFYASIGLLSAIESTPPTSMPAEARSIHFILIALSWPLAAARGFIRGLIYLTRGAVFYHRWRQDQANPIPLARVVGQ